MPDNKSILEIFYVYSIMSTLRDKKKIASSSVNVNKNNDGTTNNWGGYIGNVVKSLLYNGLYILIGIGIIYASRNLNNETYLPTNINKPPYNPSNATNFIKSFPYVPHQKGSIQTESYLLPFMAWIGPRSGISELFSKTIASSMISTRSIIKDLLEVLQEVASPSQDIERIFRMENLFVLLGPFILSLLLIIPIIPFISFITSIRTYFTTNSDIFIKLLMLLPLYFVVIFLGVYQAVYPFIFDIYSIFNMASAKKMTEYLKRFKIILYLGASMALITPAFTNLKIYYS